MTPVQALGFALFATSLVFCILMAIIHRFIATLYGDLAKTQEQLNTLTHENARLRAQVMEESNAVWKQLRNLVDTTKDLHTLVRIKR